MKGNKKLLALASAALLLGACAQETVLTPDEARELDPKSNEISFGTYMGKNSQTRAGAMGAIDDNGSLQSKGFGVFGYHQNGSQWTSAESSATPNFMYNQKVEYNSSAWTYSPIKYWPNGKDAANTSPSSTATESATQYLNFFAYAPYVGENVTSGSTTYTFEPSSGRFKSESSSYLDAVSTEYGILRMRANNAAGHPKIQYRLAQGTNFVDLLWGMRPNGTYDETDNEDNTISSDGYNTDLTKQSTAERVDFKFKHALAKIGGSDGLKILVDVDNNTTSGETGAGTLAGTTSVTVQGITIANSADAIVTDGWFDLTNGTWASYENGTALTLGTVTEGGAFNVIIGNTDLNADIYSAANSNTYTPSSTSWSVAGVTTTAKDVYKSTATPFYLMPGVANQKLKIGITYEIRTYDENLSGNYSTISQTITNEVILPSLSPNTNYKLIIHLGLTSVKFSAVVDSWDNATGTGAEQSIFLPSNVVTTP